MLQNVDEKWMDHLHELDSLKEGIHYRAYAQRDPLIEYKKEAFGLFAELNARIDGDALFALSPGGHAASRPRREARPPPVARRPRTSDARPQSGSQSCEILSSACPGAVGASLAMTTPVLSAS